MENFKGSIFKHLKSGGLYLFLEMGKIEATLEEAVIYKSLANEQVWIRPSKEFFDGRFELQHS